jgi:hypothetical protein
VNCSRQFVNKALRRFFKLLKPVHPQKGLVQAVLYLVHVIFTLVHAITVRGIFDFVHALLSLVRVVIHLVQAALHKKQRLERWASCLQ